MSVTLALAPFDPQAALAALNTAGVGAMASFVGYCRPQSDGRAVTHLVLEHYPGFTEAEIRRIGEAVAARHALRDWLIVHRAGTIEAGAPIVLVAASSEHRAAAFAAVEEIMDRLKTDAPFWKREVGAGGDRWIEPTDADRVRRGSWEQTS
jgi:molybdopterin synthase catalytic subunit